MKRAAHSSDLSLIPLCSIIAAKGVLEDFPAIFNVCRQPQCLPSARLDEKLLAHDCQSFFIVLCVCVGTSNAVLQMHYLQLFSLTEVCGTSGLMVSI